MIADTRSATWLGLSSTGAFCAANPVACLGAREPWIGGFPHLLGIVTDLKARGVAFRSLTEQMDTTTPHGELLFSLRSTRAI